MVVPRQQQHRPTLLTSHQAVRASACMRGYMSGLWMKCGHARSGPSRGDGRSPNPSSGSRQSLKSLLRIRPPVAATMSWLRQHCALSVGASCIPAICFKLASLISQGIEARVVLGTTTRLDLKRHGTHSWPGHGSWTIAVCIQPG